MNKMRKFLKIIALYRISYGPTSYGVCILQNAQRT